ncbi:hypothetical protein MCHI_000685 [Candidatus Magnetoovum chiemensis]|nr:hypothetical protein MCHI_000685 [Candidatus Magnetoovum chiemensis]
MIRILNTPHPLWNGICINFIKKACFSSFIFWLVKFYLISIIPIFYNIYKSIRSIYLSNSTAIINCIYTLRQT